MQSVEGMDILLCVVVVRGIVMWLGEKQASKQQRISGGRPRHIANFVGNHEASGSDEDCTFAFLVTETKEEICHTISCDEPVIEICVKWH